MTRPHDPTARAAHHPVRAAVPDAVDARGAGLAGAQQVIDRWLASLSSSNTRSAYRLDLAAYLRWCDAAGRDPLAPTPDVTERFRTDPSLPTGRSAVARRAAALNGFLRFADGFPVRRAVGGDSPVDATGDGREARVDAPPSSTTAELAPHERLALLEAVRTSGSATQVLVSLLMLEGLKLDEVLRLDVDHVSGRAPSMRLVVGRTPPVHVQLRPATAHVLAQHLADRDSGPLLVTASRRERDGARLSRHGADFLIRRAGERVGLPAPLTSNVLRRTHAAHAHASGDSIDAIASRMGHGDVRTTRRYLDVSAEPTRAVGRRDDAPTDLPNDLPTNQPGDVGSRRRPISQEV